MFLETIATPLLLARAVNSTSNAWPARTNTLTAPAADDGTATGQAAITFGPPLALAQNALKVVPFGTGADGATFSVRIYIWVPSGRPNSAGQYTWVALPLCEVLCTLSSGITAVAGGYVGSSNYYCNTLSVTWGNANVSVEAVSPAVSGATAHFVVDLKGGQYIEPVFNRNSSATDSNCLISTL